MIELNYLTTITRREYVGQDIKAQDFTQKDFDDYKRNLLEETKLLKSWFDNHKFAPATPHIGLELEGWLINDKGEPCTSSEEFLKIAGKDNIVPELALFNFEINAPHYPMNGDLMGLFKNDLDELWKHCEQSANKINCSTLMIGSLPSLDDSMLTMENISPYNRYYALNQRVMEMRDNIPIEINISGEEKLKSNYDCILLESAATSLQIHLEVSQVDAVDFYNASVLASPFIVAMCANSAFLCGKSLWAESRIPVFEQTVIVGLNESAHAKKRVTIGTGYLKESLFELFEENQELYPTLIPHVTDESADKMNHVNFHNGTVWRWNRPIIGFNSDGTPHLRIEHRVIPAGPSQKDTLANIMLFLGLVHVFKDSAKLMTKQISFEDNYINLYEAARNGIQSDFIWKNNQNKSLTEIFQDELMPMMSEKLASLGFSNEDIDTYINGVIGGRLKTGVNGSKWQKEFVARHGRDYKNLVLNYQKHQNSGLAVHEWPLD